MTMQSNVHRVQNFSPDILIIGAGPAGSACAIELCRLGYTVCLIDKAHFPRSQIGESLPPSIFPLLDYLGVRSMVEDASFIKAKRTKVIWGAQQFERDHSQDMEGLNVDRGVFDNILVQAAAVNGADIQLGMKVSQKQRRSEDKRWDVIVHDGQDQHHLSPRFIVNACGRRGTISKERQRIGRAQLALYTYWNLSTDVGVQDTFIETGEDNWGWCCKLSNKQAVVALFLDPSLIKGKGKTSLENIYLQRLKKKSFSKSVINGFIKRPVQACNASITRSSDPIMDGLIDVGDACFAQDPLSSQGVQGAIAMALQATAVVNTVLRNPKKQIDAELFYKDKLEKKVVKHLEHIKEHCQEAYRHYRTEYWERRADLPVRYNVRGVSIRKFQLTGAQIVTLGKDVKVVTIQVIRNSLIQEEVALWRPGLEAPIILANTIPVVELLKTLYSAQRVEFLIFALRVFGPPEQLLMGLEYFVSIGLLVVCDQNRV
ncbi:NAD(P)/FAD-dependent oxidoreductase [Vibrio parahaemolyticus]|uniref:flavin-dependent monooxygenase QhpG n=1 Tax=Vibrio parahaemolyticus TaxID=670 RepID=UPI0022B50CDC|nr:NAD(P)/FAD-dependent oxidoreductase [Vibrio parahaemolyticus]MBE5179463.1 NAD(P)/FAD-dependent oxidoreductase [Vibrio parahaemolyticus]MCZ6401714.1 NAD(P)/FAD-dependent oxidoreductase [Vibrio parahaemolyticus]